MKPRLHWLICLLLLATKGMAQTGNYYWAGNKKVLLTTDPNSLTVKFSDASNTAALSRVKQKAAKGKLTSASRAGLVTISDITDAQQLKKLLKAEAGVEFVLQNFILYNNSLKVSDHIIVKPKKQVEIGAIIAKFPEQLTLVTNTTTMKYLFRSNDPEKVIELANAIYESGMAEYAYPDFSYPYKTTQTDPYEYLQYYLNNYGQTGGVVGLDINAPEAWTLSKGCNNPVKVAVIDDGVEYHEDFDGRLLPGYTIGSGTAGAPLVTAQGHGVAVTGIIAATHNNDLGIKGIAPSAQIIPVNIFSGGATDFQIAAAIEWAWDIGGADVLSNSWNFTSPSYTSVAITDAITEARTLGRGGKGAIVVFSSGNDFESVHFPANVPDVITVGAISHTGGIWPYSNSGPEMDLVAPSGDGELGGNIPTTDRMGAAGYNTSGNYVFNFGGTSAAAPQVSAAAALLLAMDASLTEVQVRTILQQTASDVAANGYDNSSGYGLLNIQAAMNKVVGIIGPDFICNSGVVSVPLNSMAPNITWSISNPSMVSFTTSGNTASITKINNGALTVNAVVSGTCGTFYLTKTILIGNAANHNICGPNYDICNAKRGENISGTFRVCTPEAIPGYNYVWDIDGNGVGAGTSINVRGFLYSPGFHTIRFRATNGPCGPTDWTTSTFRVITCNTNPRLSELTVNLSPNPAKNIVNVSADNASLQSGAGFTQIRIVDKFGKVHRTFNYASGTRSASLNLSGIKADLYTVQIFDGQDWINKKIVLQP